MRALSASFLGMMLLAPYEGTETAPVLVGRIDVTAILRSWRIKGVLVCHHRGEPYACLWVENAWPCGLLEVVRRPFTSHLAEAAGPLGRAASAGLTSSGAADRGQTNLQFGEARVFSFIPSLPDGIDLPLAVPRGPFLRLHYASELDAAAWRTGMTDRLLQPSLSFARCETAPAPEACAGRWGSYYPREGFLIHQSEPLASLVIALRGGRAASAPGGRVAFSRYPFEPRTGHFLQTVRPRPRSAIRIGQAGPVDAGAGSVTGAYLYIHLGIFEGCRRCLRVRLVGTR